MLFADEPLLEVTGPLIEAQLLETAVINFCHLQTVQASKAARVGARGRRPPARRVRPPAQSRHRRRHEGRAGRATWPGSTPPATCSPAATYGAAALGHDGPLVRHGVPARAGRVSRLRPRLSRQRGAAARHLRSRWRPRHGTRSRWRGSWRQRGTGWPACGSTAATSARSAGEVRQILDAGGFRRRADHRERRTRRARHRRAAGRGRADRRVRHRHRGSTCRPTRRRSTWSTSWCGWTAGTCSS